MTGRRCWRAVALAVVAGAAGVLAVAGPVRAAPPPLPPLPCNEPVRVAFIDPPAQDEAGWAAWAAGQISARGRTALIDPGESDTGPIPLLLLMRWRPAKSGETTAVLSTYVPESGDVDQVALAEIVTGPNVESDTVQRAAVAAWWRTAMPPCSAASPAPSPSPTPTESPSPSPTDDVEAVTLPPDDGRPPAPLPDLVGVDPGDPGVDVGPRVGPDGVVLSADTPARVVDVLDRIVDGAAYGLITLGGRSWRATAVFALVMLCLLNLWLAGAGTGSNAGVGGRR